MHFTRSHSHFYTRLESCIETLLSHRFHLFLYLIIPNLFIYEFIIFIKAEIQKLGFCFAFVLIICSQYLINSFIVQEKWGAAASCVGGYAKIAIPFRAYVRKIGKNAYDAYRTHTLRTDAHTRYKCDTRQRKMSGFLSNGAPNLRGKRRDEKMTFPKVSIDTLK